MDTSVASDDPHDSLVDFDSSDEDLISIMNIYM